MPRKLIFTYTKPAPIKRRLKRCHPLTVLSFSVYISPSQETSYLLADFEANLSLCTGWMGAHVEWYMGRMEGEQRPFATRSSNASQSLSWLHEGHLSSSLFHSLGSLSDQSLILAPGKEEGGREHQLSPRPKKKKRLTKGG